MENMDNKRCYEMLTRDENGVTVGTAMAQVLKRDPENKTVTIKRLVVTTEKNPKQRVIIEKIKETDLKRSIPASEWFFGVLDLGTTLTLEAL